MYIFSVFLVIVGLIALVLSLIPLTGICRYETGYRLGWRAMFVLVLAFILGYMFFCYHLMFKAPALMDLILASIFAGGGFFVVLVSRMSLASLNELQEAALVHEQQALHDELTGLPNRKSLMLTLTSTVAASGRGDAHFAVIVMDLNGFKEVNDTLGHQAGDIALQIIAPRLSKQLRASDTLCRMGGDEFAVILPQTGRKESALVAKKILAATAEPMTIENKKIIIGISIGIALSPDNARDGNTLLRYADIAMYQAKQQKAGIEIYSKEIDSSSIDETERNGN
jgi:diguanylate cyclase (GGDEF)-like protein